MAAKNKEVTNSTIDYEDCCRGNKVQGVSGIVYCSDCLNPLKEEEEIESWLSWDSKYRNQLG